MEILADCHIHSNTSPDAVDAIAPMCRRAIARGLTHISFCNHYEIFPGRGTVQEYLLDFDAYSDEIERARDEFGDRLTILKGVEFGQPHHHPREYEQLLRRDFDNVTISLHALPVEISIFWLWIDLAETRRQCRSHVLETYFEEMLLLSEVSGYDVLAHFDWLKNCYPDDGSFAPQIDEIMQKLVKNHITLEINSRGLRDGLGEPFPSDYILESYRRAGGQRVTVGSDAHRAADVGADFDTVGQIVERFGFDYGCFQNRRFVSLR